METKAENTNQTRISEISPNIPPKSEITTFQIGLAIIPVVFVTALAFLFFKQVKYRKERYHRTFRWLTQSLKHARLFSFCSDRTLKWLTVLQYRLFRRLGTFWRFRAWKSVCFKTLQRSHPIGFGKPMRSTVLSSSRTGSARSLGCRARHSLA